MANDSPAKSLVDIDLSSLRVSVRRSGNRWGAREGAGWRSPWPPSLSHKAGDDGSPGMAFVIQRAVMGRKGVGGERERVAFGGEGASLLC